MTAQKRTRKPAQRFRVLVGLDYHGKRAEPGQVRRDIPEKSIPWLLLEGLIEPVEEVE